MMLLFHGSVVGWFPALSPLSHLQLIIPSLSFFFPGSSPLIRLCLFPFFHCFNASCQIECLRVTTLSFLDYRALQGLCFLSETPPPPFFFFNFLSHFFFLFLLRQWLLFPKSFLLQTLTSSFSVFLRMEKKNHDIRERVP